MLQRPMPVLEAFPTISIPHPSNAMNQQQIGISGSESTPPLFPVVVYDVDDDAMVLVLRQPRDHDDGDDPFHAMDSDCEREEGLV